MVLTRNPDKHFWSGNLFSMYQTTWQAKQKRIRERSNGAWKWVKLVKRWNSAFKIRVCFSDFQPPGCVGSNLFRAFSQHFLHRLSITNRYPLRTRADDSSKRKIRVTLLQRGRPEMEGVYRQIDNQIDLVDSLHKFDDFDVQVGYVSLHFAFCCS